MALLSAPALADPCPGAVTCPQAQTAAVEGSSLVLLQWTEPAQMPVAYYITSTPASQQPGPAQSNGPGLRANYWAGSLNPATAYVFKICAYYTASNQSCVTTASVTTLPASGGETPTPLITGVSVTAGSITINWTGAGQTYNKYQTLLDGFTNPDLPGGVSGSYTFDHLNAGMGYQVGVQGCLNSIPSRCSPWATINVTTTPPPPPPPPPAVAPQNLHTVNGPADIDVLWTNPPGEQQTSVIRAPGWAPGSQFKWLSASNIDDLSAAPGQLYTYKVCLQFQTGMACASTTGALPPQCKITYPCPLAVYTPPDYQVQCTGSTDFYSRDPSGNRTFVSTGTQVSGTTADYDYAIVACAAGSKDPQSCSAYSIFKGPQDWCAAPPLPVPQPPGTDCCKACRAAGGDCNRGPHGCTCF
jgi:hypothetical protein